MFDTLVNMIMDGGFVSILLLAIAAGYSCGSLLNECNQKRHKDAITD